MDELQPCPFCGGNAKLHIRQIRFVGQNDFGDKKIRCGAQVICNRCKARGPLYTGVVKNPSVRADKNGSEVYVWITREAAEAWNRRTNHEQEY